jgi:hypothetical protein
MEVLNALWNMLRIALEPVGVLVQSFTSLPMYLTSFVAAMGEPMMGFGVVIGLALGALVLRVVIHIL